MGAPFERALLLAGLSAACILSGGCRKRSMNVQDTADSPRVVKLEELSEAERRYGHPARRKANVTYQPDVVILPAGANAVRAAMPDGLTWTIDPEAEGAGDIRPGKVLLLTSRAAGRVLNVRKGADGLQVILGPAEITEIVRDGEFTLDQPLDPSQALTYAVPEVFDPIMPLDPVVVSSKAGALAPLAHPGACAPARQEMLVVLAGTWPGCETAASALAPEHQFKMQPISGGRGFGVKISSNEGRVLFLGEAVLELNAPKLYFNLLIQGGKIVTAEVRMEGAAGLMMTFEAASPSPIIGNIDAKRFAPVDWSFPVVGMGVPFAVTVRQQFQLRTVFTSTGSLKARAYYRLRGGLGAGYRDGHWGVSGPTGVAPVESLDHLLMSTQGAAFGVTGIIMTHQAKLMVGVGAFGFATGPYGYLNSTVTVARGSDLGILTGPLACKQATLSMGVGAGVGYIMPQPVTNLINSFLRALNIREEISSSGGLEAKPAEIVKIGRYHPSLKACGK